MKTKEELSDEELAAVAGGASQQNQSADAAQSFGKLSSGAKVKSSYDNPTGFQIAERMRPQSYAEQSPIGRSTSFESENSEAIEWEHLIGS